MRRSPGWRAATALEDRRNEAQRPAAEESGSGLAAPCSRWMWLGPCISYASAIARIYIRGAGLGHAGLGLDLVRSIPLAGVWPMDLWNMSKRGDNK